MAPNLIAAPILLAIALKFCESGRILAIMPTPSYSHQIVFNPLWLALNSRGHHVTLFTTDPIKNQNLTNFRQVDWSFAYTLWHEKHNASAIIRNFSTNIVKCLYQYVQMMTEITIEELEHPEVQQILKNQQEQFDLVVLEILNPAMMAFSERFKAPFIGMSSMDVTNFVHESLGNPVSPGLFPDFVAPFDGDMTFLERIANTFYYLGSKLYFRYYLYPKNDEIVKKYFGEETPKLEELQKNVSVVFLNTNPIIHNIRPLMSHVFMMGGGTHFDRDGVLPSDIQQFLNEAASGAIYFSLGTNVKSKDVSQLFLEVFSELPYRVLWKSEDDEVATSSQIIARRWLPQQQILKHPNIKLFITQGGLQSLEETIYSAVPIVAIPVYIDQFANVRKVTRKGLGIALDYNNLEKESLKKAINDVITHEKYKLVARELSILLQERPTSALDDAVRWVEYVMKYKGARFLKPVDLPLHQYLLLDVFAFLLLILGVFLFFAHVVLKVFILCVKEKRKDKSKYE